MTKTWVLVGLMSAVTAQSAFACGEPEASADAAALVRSIEPLHDVLVRYREPRNRTARTLRDGDYRTRFGWRIDRACFADGETPEKIEATLQRLADGVRSCGRHRLFDRLQARFQRVMRRRLVITCDPDDCSAGAAACAEGRRSINFTRPVYLSYTSTWFHEVLHIANIDNQPTADHNNWEETEMRDEVFFWEDVCFEPSAILKRMREGDAEACSRPLEYRGTWRARRRPTASVKAMCGMFEGYLEKEKRFRKLLEREYLPAVLTCEDAECQAVREFNDYHAVSGGVPLLPDPADPGPWLRGRCDNYADPSGRWFALASCLEYAQMYYLSGSPPHTMGGGTYAKLTGYLQKTIERARLADKLGGQYTGFVGLAEAGSAELPLEIALNECRAGDERTAPVCEAFHAKVKRPMAELLGYWK